MSADEVKKTIDTVVTDPATASAVESKTIKLGMSPDEVNKSLENSDKIVDWGKVGLHLQGYVSGVLNSQVRTFNRLSLLNPYYPPSMAVVVWETLAITASSKERGEGWDSSPRSTLCTVPAFPRPYLSRSTMKEELCR